MMNSLYLLGQKVSKVGKKSGSTFAALAFVLSFISISAFSQSISVSGKVTDTDGMELPGVTVQVKGTTNGTSTGIDGTYSLSNVPGNGTIVYSFVGMQPQEIAVQGQTVINVSLANDDQVLEEVVVVGYGTVKKKDATGAVNAIGTKDFQKGIVTSPEQLMQGKVAGVQITQSSGEPGGGINIRIRGTSSVYGGNNPLFVIDGVPLSGDNTSAGGDSQGLGRQPAKNPLNFLNPEDILSIDILKDASATAIYGARGAQGVVLITTKKGSGKGTLSYGFSLGASNITKKYDLLNADEFASANPSQDRGADVDWQNELFQTGITQQHNLSYGGGDATGNYRFSLGYLDQEGIVLTSGIKRYSIGFNGGKKFINNKLNITSSVNLANTQDRGVGISENSGYTGDLLAAIIKSNPTMPVYTGGEFTQPGITEPNPLAIVNYNKDRTNTLRALGNIAAELELLEGLKFKTVLGFDKSLSSRKNAFSSDLVLDGVSGIGRLYITDIEADNNLWENYFTYDKEFGSTSLNALLGYSYQSFDGYYKSSSLANFATSDLDVMINNLASADASKAPSNVVNNSSSEKDELQSYFTRVNLNMGNKYLLTGTLRIDGSTKFGGNNKYGYFPSGAFKWKLIEEDFVPRNVFSDLALRVGYGLVGNQNIPHNLYDRRDRYSGWGANQGATDISGGGLNAVAFNNPDLKWESTSTLNIGLDFGIMNNKVSGNIEFYDKHTKDLLFQVVSAQPAPTPFVWRNLDTDIQNRGVELGLNVIAVDNTNFTWEVNLNGAYNKNIIKNLSGVYDTGQINGQGLTGAFAQRLAEGQPMFAYFVREFGGYDDQGNSIYPNGDFQQFNGASPNPTFTAGLNNSFRFGNFDASFFFNGVFGNYIYNNTANAYFTKGALNNGRNVTRDVVGTDEGPWNAPDVSSRFLEKGDFVRLQNLNLGYRVPMSGSNAISGIRLFITGQNLATFTKYSGQDPEVSTNKSLNGIPSFGIDYTAYPRAKTWTIGANVSF
ncbi:SusC/RagA family TonB-linked outer membrane protein [Jiulongibacter sediminis]|uniref:TonB-dependent receptor n=1 Tax=Jiulongibacter sediminis TaxID=1605367 RepID=A0A0P7C4N0_9BACT|nr:SusC/RagA family TonB-linked outer membrane protein [Jiulongibacter sediminis]KPM48217.1 TonB-dependent receptor [Jiulongibacter sediminis]TBX24760.1 TonB-dependent receptor [Jiulongibacter sediminis]